MKIFSSGNLQLSLVCSLLSLVLICATSCDNSTNQQKESLAGDFVRLINEGDRDSLDLIIGKNFELLETSSPHTWTRQGFLDTFLVYSQNVNGIFKIVSTKKISEKETTIKLLDQSDYHVHLMPGKELFWHLTIFSDSTSITSARSDSMPGLSTYINEFAKKQEAFFSWLNKTYPNESVAELYREKRLATRLKEYTTRSTSTNE